MSASFLSATAQRSAATQDAGASRAPPRSTGPQDDSTSVVLRFIYRGEVLRNGRVLLLPKTVLSEAVVRGSTILESLASAEANVPLHRLVPYYYDCDLEGWRRLSCESTVLVRDTGLARVEVMLEQPATTHESMSTPFATHGRAASLALRHATSLASGASACVAEDLSELTAAVNSMDTGYFGVGVYNSKSAENVGTLWRSAFMLGASFLFTVGSRNAWEKSADTYKAWRRVPAFRYNDWGAFSASAPYSATWVAVEMGGVPLHEFVHPERAVYVLGAEDAGLPPSIVRACPLCVSLEGGAPSGMSLVIGM